MILILKNVFSTLIVRYFGEKSENFQNLEKLENMMKSSFEKKTFSS